MASDIIASRIRQYLCDYRGLSPDELPAEGRLFTGGLLDSLDIVLLVNFVETEFGITINPYDVSIESFDSIDAIRRFLEARGVADRETGS